MNNEDVSAVEEYHTYYAIPSDECLKGYKQRMNNLAPFVSFVKRLGGIQRYPEYDVMSLGFGTLLFILENMLIGKEECRIDDIAFFLQRTVDRVYKTPITIDEAKEMAFHIRDAVMGSGETYAYEYMNLENGVRESIDVKLTDVAYYEMKKTSLYKLTEQGMEMLFKTREIYSEFRINITQLYLKQQIEKGVFSGALQTLNELNLQVRQLREHLTELVVNIRQNVLELEFEIVQNVFDRIRNQLEKEHKEFSNIKYILNEQRKNFERISLEQFTKNDRNSLNQIQILTERLEIVAGEHDRLFNEKLDIISEYINVLENRMRLGIAENVDFEKDVLDIIMRSSTSLDSVGHVLEPLFSNFRKNIVFNIMKALNPQGIRSEEEEKKESVDLEGIVEQKEKELKIAAIERNNRVMSYIEIIFTSILKEKRVNLRSILKLFPPQLYNIACSDFDFYSILVMMHQREIIDLELITEMSDKLIFDFSNANINLEYVINGALKANKSFNSIKRIRIQASGNSIKLSNNNIITDFIFTEEQ